MACADVHVDMNTTHLDWIEENRSVFKNSGDGNQPLIVLPKEYKVYSLDSVQVQAFFTALNKGENLVTAIPLPSPTGCQVFTITNNIPEGVRMPAGMVGGMGEAMGQKMSISYYHGDVTAHISWFDLPYEISTIRSGGKPYLIVYTKQAPPENPNIERDPSKYTPQIQPILYDK